MFYPLTYVACLNFNSIKVRLKPRYSGDVSCLFDYFNSIKVRLKLEFTAALTGIFIFQFHKGTIKTR